MNATRYAASCFALSVAACQSTGPLFNAYDSREIRSERVAVAHSDPPPALRSLHPTEFTLAPGDVVELELVGDPATHTRTVVGPDGRLYFHLLNGVDVSGLTVAQAKHKLEAGLTQYYQGKPEVSVSVPNSDSRKVTVMGRVNSPGVYPMTGPTTLLDALAMAGGPAASVAPGVVDDAADLDRSVVVRNGKTLPVNVRRLLRNGDMAHNIQLQPNDIVFLPSRAISSAYVLGAVAQPRSIPFVDGRPTLLTAISNAGGTLRGAHLQRVALVRGSTTNPRITFLDYRAIARGKQRDVSLAPGDLVYVPGTPVKSLQRYAETITRTFAQTVGANEGARAVVPGAAPLGGSVGIGGSR